MLRIVRDRKSLRNAPCVVGDVLENIQEIMNSRELWGRMLAPVASKFKDGNKHLSVENLIDLVYKNIKTVSVFDSSADDGFVASHLASALVNYEDSSLHRVMLNLDQMSYCRFSDLTFNRLKLILWVKVFHECLNCCTPAVNIWGGDPADQPTSVHIGTMMCESGDQG